MISSQNENHSEPEKPVFAIIQFLALILIVSSWIEPEVALGIDSDFERQLGRADEQLLERYQLQQDRQARRSQTIGPNRWFSDFSGEFHGSLEVRAIFFRKTNIDKTYLKTYVYNMTTISATKARDQLYRLIDEANDSHEPIQITESGGMRSCSPSRIGVPYGKPSI